MCLKLMCALARGHFKGLDFDLPNPVSLTLNIEPGIHLYN